MDGAGATKRDKSAATSHDGMLPNDVAAQVFLRSSGLYNVATRSQGIRLFRFRRHALFNCRDEGLAGRRTVVSEPSRGESREDLAAHLSGARLGDVGTTKPSPTDSGGDCEIRVGAV